jgi:hypothetical protein
MCWLDDEKSDIVHMLMDPKGPDDWYKVRLMGPEYSILHNSDEERAYQKEISMPMKPYRQAPAQAVTLYSSDDDGYFYRYEVGFYLGMWAAGLPRYKDPGAGRAYKGIMPLTVGNGKHALMIGFFQLAINNTDDLESPNWEYYTVPYDSVDEEYPTDLWKEDNNYVKQLTDDYDSEDWFYDSYTRFIDTDWSSGSPEGYFGNGEYREINTLTKAKMRLRYYLFKKYESGYTFRDMFKKKNWNVHWIDIGRKLYDMLMSDDAKKDPENETTRQTMMEIALPNTKYKIFSHLFKTQLITKVAIPIPIFKGWNTIIPGSQDWDYLLDDADFGEKRVDSQTGLVFSTYSEAIKDGFYVILAMGAIALFVKFGKTIINMIKKQFNAMRKRNKAKKKHAEIVDGIHNNTSILQYLMKQQRWGINAKTNRDVLTKIANGVRVGKMDSSQYRRVLDLIKRSSR